MNDREEVVKKSNTIYEVKISRKYVKSNLDRFVQGDFWWDVDTRTNGSYQSDLSQCGWAKTLEKAKAKALKHILDVETKLGEGEKFGVYISVEGTAEEVTKELQ
jgi:hypothetical protein